MPTADRPQSLSSLLRHLLQGHNPKATIPKVEVEVAAVVAASRKWAGKPPVALTKVKHLLGSRKSNRRVVEAVEVTTALVNQNEVGEAQGLEDAVSA